MSRRLARPLTAVEMAATSFERFQDSYKDWNDDDKFADGKTAGEVRRRFNTEARTPETVADILNTTWSHPECDCCAERFAVVVEMKEEWSEESLSICIGCAKAAVAMLAQFPNSSERAP